MQEHHQQYHVFSMKPLLTPYQNISTMIALSHYKNANYIYLSIILQLYCKLREQFLSNSYTNVIILS